MLLCLACIIIAEPAYAAGSSEYLKYSEQQPAASTSMLSTIAYVFSLIITFGFVIGLAYFASKFLGQKMSNLNHSSDNKILTTLSLGPNKSVCVVEIAGRVFILGVTDHNINLLQELSVEEEIAKIKAQSNLVPEAANYEQLFQNQFTALRQMASKFPTTFKNFSSKYSREKR